MPVARLKPGVTVAQAQVEMDVIARGMEQAYPESNKGVGERVIPLRDTLYQSLGICSIRLWGRWDLSF